MEEQRVFRVCITGAQSCGKSSLILRFLHDEFDGADDPTIEDSYNGSLTENGKEYHIRFLDTGGLESLEHIVKKWYSWGFGFLCVYNVTSLYSFEYIPLIHALIQKFNQRDTFPMVLVGTQCDQPNREVSKEDGEQLARQFDCPFYETSSKEGTNVKEVFRSLVQNMLKFENAEKLESLSRLYSRKSLTLKSRRSFFSDKTTSVLFGVPLEKVPRSQSSDVPDFMTFLMDYLRRSGAIQQEGVFRLSGNGKVTEQLKESLNNGVMIDFDTVEGCSSHCVTVLFKHWFKEFPEPLIPFHVYPDFLSLAGKLSSPKCFQSTLEVISKLPKTHRRVLAELMTFLREVSELAAQNKMTAHNLATVFGPNLAYAKDTSDAGKYIREIGQVNQIIEFLIVNSHELFPKLNDKDKKEASKRNSRTLFSSVFKSPKKSLSLPRETTSHLSTRKSPRKSIQQMFDQTTEEDSNV